MGFQIMKMPGYTVVGAGEVIHLIKCIPGCGKLAVSTFSF